MRRTGKLGDLLLEAPGLFEFGEPPARTHVGVNRGNIGVGDHRLHLRDERRHRAISCSPYHAIVRRSPSSRDTCGTTPEQSSGTIDRGDPSRSPPPLEGSNTTRPVNPVSLTIIFTRSPIDVSIA